MTQKEIALRRRLATFRVEAGMRVPAPPPAGTIDLQTLKTLLAGRIVFDIGQFTPEAAKWLRKEVKAKRVQTMLNYQRYPNGKRMYWIPE